MNSINDRFSIDGNLDDVDDSMFVNIDKTAVYYDSNSTTTINTKGDNTISLCCIGLNARRMTKETKLPLPLVFKQKTNGRIEKNQENELDDGIFACCQAKDWMDENISNRWIEKIWKPHVYGKG